MSQRAKTIVAAIQAQHRQLIELSMGLDRAIAEWRLEELRTTLPKLRDGLDAHVAFENREFYPALLERARATDEGTATLVKLFDDNMKLVADGVYAFLDRYAGKPAFDRAVFEKDWKTVFHVLGKRLKDEEKTLHPLFLKLHAAEAA